MEQTYPGLTNDKHGLTQLGRIVLDGRLFGLIADSEDCAGWSMGRMQDLMERVQNEWEEFANLPSRLPPHLLKRHGELYDQAIQTARAKGWNPELGEDE
ncbi:MAG TPA: hypothetical protein VFF82_13645 [Rhodocyclaceae bacterium]|nr:hypothetical protein [Rhodocyclaceae bacterium]